MVSRAQLGAEVGLWQAATVRDLFLERCIFRSISSNCLVTDLDSISAVDCHSAPFGSSTLSENVIVKDGNFRVFGGLPKPGFRHG